MKIYAPEGVQDIYRALAFENVMLEHPAAENGLLFCWTGDVAVVMGKNQNPWRECNLEFIREHKCKLARRVSGGGTVYHDPGNLNISWILPREGYRAEEMHALLIRALKRLGLPAEMGKGGSLSVNGKKISGSAFCYRKDRVLHHGTLLVDANLNTLCTALTPPRMRMDTHAVDSVPASVTNLQELNPDLTKQHVLDAIFKEAEDSFGALSALETLPGLDGEVQRLGADEWIWGQTPRFQTDLSLPNGKTLTIKVHKGKLTECLVGEQEISLEIMPDFPKGDFGELEQKLGISSESFSIELAKAGWVKP